jgi:hypothetical protein
LNDQPLISIVIVHFKVPEFLLRALRSLRQALFYDQSEVIVVDNASMDHSKQTVIGEFPEIKWIDLKSNIGFGKACNVGAKSAGGTYLLFINPIRWFRRTRSPNASGSCASVRTWDSWVPKSSTPTGPCR